MSIIVSEGLFNPLTSEVSYNVQLPVGPQMPSPHPRPPYHPPHPYPHPGIPGPQGVQGIQGIQGIRGEHGHIGIQGPSGLNYESKIKEIIHNTSDHNDVEYKFPYTWEHNLNCYPIIMYLKRKVNLETNEFIGYEPVVLDVTYLNPNTVELRASGPDNFLSEGSLLIAR